MHKEIRFAGFGGQGIMLAGHIVGKAAALYEKKNAVLTQSYGPEARGGASSADVIIATHPISYPKVTAPDIITLMSQEAYHTYGGTIKKDAIIIIDEDLVKLEKGERALKIPATRLAEQLGKKIIANIVMLGFFTAVTNVVSYEAMKNAVLSSVPKGTEELNLKAFNSGYEYGRNSKLQNSDHKTKNLP